MNKSFHWLGSRRSFLSFCCWNTPSLTLSFDYRAVSDTPNSTVTNLRIWIYDPATGQLLDDFAAVAGGVTDTGWTSYEMDLAAIANTVSTDLIQIVINIRDAWNANHHQQAWVDNISLEQTP